MPRVYRVRGRGPAPGSLAASVQSAAAPGDLVTVAHNWATSEYAWITIGPPSTPCLERSTVWLAEGISPAQSEALAEAVGEQYTSCVVVPLDSDGTKQVLHVPDRDLPCTRLAKMDMVRMENVELVRALYWQPQQQRREVLWCRHCLSLANESIGTGKLPETDCSPNGYKQMCERQKALRGDMALGCSSLKRAMRTALVLGGGRPATKKVPGCDAAEGESQITVYPELKEHQNTAEKAFKHIMYTQSTTDKKNIQKQSGELNRQYAGVQLAPVQWTPDLEGIAKTNEPDFAYFMTNRLFAGPQRQMIVSHGHFLAKYVLGRFSRTL